MPRLHPTPIKSESLSDFKAPKVILKKVWKGRVEAEQVEQIVQSKILDINQNMSLNHTKSK